MVECEYKQTRCRSRRSRVLIDTWWNVNNVLGSTALVRVTVLIDTWWNVNEFLSVIDKYFTVVLIDTWWNVNRYMFSFVLRYLSF